MRYADLIRDARDESLSASTRIRAAFDALYTCCLQFDGSDDARAGRGEQFVKTVVGRALSSIPFSAENADLLSKLADWVLHVAPLSPLPMSPEEAIALAERVHNALQEKGAC